MKCKMCNENLAGGISSAKKSNGDFYLICPKCNTVYYIKHLQNGLTEIENTSMDNTPETKDQMKEAIELFGKKNIYIGNIKVGIHDEVEENNSKKNDLKKYAVKYDLSIKDVEELHEKYLSLENENISFDQYLNSFVNFERDIKRMKEDHPEAIDFVANFLSAFLGQNKKKNFAPENFNSLDEYRKAALNIVEEDFEDFINEQCVKYYALTNAKKPIYAAQDLETLKKTLAEDKCEVYDIRKLNLSYSYDSIQ